MNLNCRITGNLINTYYVCHRKLWFFAHKINPIQDHSHLEIGRLIHEGSYKREKKEIEFSGFKIDVIKNKGSNLVVAEVKKSSKAMKPARMQLLFYLYKLKQIGVFAEGELLIPKERKKEKVLLTEESEEEIRRVISEIKKILESDIPPEFKKSSFCKKCAYQDFCFS